MRNNIISCELQLNNDDLSKEVFNSLKYSTHCVYLLENEKYDISEFVHIKRLSEIGENCTNNISVVNNELYFNTKEYTKIDDFTIKFDCCKEFKKDRVYFFIDFEGSINILGAINGNTVDINESVGELSEIIINHFLNGNTLNENKVYCLRKTETTDNMLLTSVINPDDLNLFRFYGINIPLVLIQNIYKRKVKTFVFIRSNAMPVSRKYSLDGIENVYFDLDQTLIWEGNPINDTVKLLNYFQSLKLNIILITRHKLNILKTLKSIKINHEIFSEIIKVEDGQKKSSFINDKSIFIDNEFPERFDVMNNTIVNAYDLDQIEFF